MKKGLKALIRKEINKTDPVGLLSMGAPKDEYNPEIEEIMTKIHLCKNTTGLEELIYKTFAKMFDERLAGQRKLYRELAYRIFNKLKS